MEKELIGVESQAAVVAAFLKFYFIVSTHEFIICCIFIMLAYKNTYCIGCYKGSPPTPQHYRIAPTRETSSQAYSPVTSFL